MAEAPSSHTIRVVFSRSLESHLHRDVKLEFDSDAVRESVFSFTFDTSCTYFDFVAGVKTALGLSLTHDVAIYGFTVRHNGTIRPNVLLTQDYNWVDFKEKLVAVKKPYHLYVQDNVMLPMSPDSRLLFLKFYNAEARTLTLLGSTLVSKKDAFAVLFPTLRLLTKTSVDGFAIWEEEDVQKGIIKMYLPIQTLVEKDVRNGDILVFQHLGGSPAAVRDRLLALRDEAKAPPRPKMSELIFVNEHIFEGKFTTVFNKPEYSDTVFVIPKETHKYVCVCVCVCVCSHMVRSFMPFVKSGGGGSGSGAQSLGGLDDNTDSEMYSGRDEKENGKTEKKEYRYYASKAILVPQSHYCQVAFQSKVGAARVDDGGRTEVVLDQTPRREFEVLLRFLYNETPIITTPDVDILQLFLVADFFGVADLKAQVETIITNDINEDNCLQALHIGYSADSTCLKLAAANFLRRKKLDPCSLKHYDALDRKVIGELLCFLTSGAFPKPKGSDDPKLTGKKRLRDDSASEPSSAKRGRVGTSPKKEKEKP